MFIYYLGENDLFIKYVFCDIMILIVLNLICIMEIYYVLDSLFNFFFCSWNVCYRKNCDFFVFFNCLINIKIVI